MAKKEKHKVEKAVPSKVGNWLAVAAFSYIEGVDLGSKKVEDKQSFVVEAKDEKSAYEAAKKALEEKTGTLKSLDLKVQSRVMTAKENANFLDTKTIPVF